MHGGFAVVGSCRAACRRRMRRSWLDMTASLWVGARDMHVPSVDSKSPDAVVMPTARYVEANTRSLLELCGDRDTFAPPTTLPLRKVLRKGFVGDKGHKTSTARPATIRSHRSTASQQTSHQHHALAAALGHAGCEAKYDRLFEHLCRAGDGPVTMTFTQIEELVGTLPRSARTLRRLVGQRVRGNPRPSQSMVERRQRSRLRRPQRRNRHVLPRPLEPRSLTT